jgi:hypothetical protein
MVLIFGYIVLLIRLYKPIEGIWKITFHFIELTIRNILENKRKHTLQSSVGRRLSSLSSIVRSHLVLDIWCTRMLSSFWMVKIGNTLSGKVLLMLNNNLLIFRLARFYSNLGRFNRWSILSLRYIVPDSKLYSLTVGFKNKI